MKGGQMDWTPENTKVFIDIIYDRVKKKQLQIHQHLKVTFGKKNKY